MRGGERAVVYEAEDRWGRCETAPVYVKVLRPDLVRDPIPMLQMRRELDLLSGCDHPGIVSPLATGLDVPDGLTSLRAEHCGSCHPDIYEEWRTTTHAHAWTDPQLQEEMKKSSNRWLCEIPPAYVVEGTTKYGLSCEFCC